MRYFTMNGLLWRTIYVSPNSPLLVDRSGKLTVATTDPSTRCVYLSTELIGEFKTRVFIHELGHCAMVSFNMLDDIHRMVYPEYWIEAEEYICNFLADYGLRIFSIAYDVLGSNAMIFIPHEIEKLVG